MKLERERNDVVAFGKKMITSRLTTATGGNISVFNREHGLIAVSPSAMDYMETQPEDIVVLRPDGSVVEGSRTPSSETPLHLAQYRHRSDIGAVVHTHSVYATTIAALRWEIPPMHYLIGLIGRKVPIASYATFATEELAQATAAALGDGNAVLMANHGLLTVGRTLAAAFAAAEVVELLAQVYYQAKCIGEPVMLTDAQVTAVLERFSTYSRQK